MKRPPYLAMVGRYLLAVLLQPGRLVNVDVNDDVSGHDRLRSAAWRTSRGLAGGSLADDGGSQEPTALVEHALFDHLVRSQQH
jgi:hypothetical protein